MKNYLAPPKPARINLVDILLIAVPLTVVIAYVVTGPVMKSWNERRSSIAQRDARLLSLAVIQHQQNHGDHLPTAVGWEDALRPYLSNDAHDSLNEFLCPPSPYWEPPRRFACNRAIGGKSLNGLDQPGNVVLFYESSLPGPNAADDLKHPAPTNAGGIVMVFPEGNHPDGITEYVSDDRVDAFFQASHQGEARLK